jgi:hypothetical protein
MLTAEKGPFDTLTFLAVCGNLEKLLQIKTVQF